MTHDTTQNGTSRASAVAPPFHGLPAEGTPSAAGETGAGSISGATTPSMSGEPHRPRPIIDGALRERNLVLLEQLDLTRREVQKMRRDSPGNRGLLLNVGTQSQNLAVRCLVQRDRSDIQAAARTLAAAALRVAAEGDEVLDGLWDRVVPPAPAEEGDLFEEESAAPVMAAAREVPVVGTIGGASVPPAPEKVTVAVPEPEPTLMQRLWDLWPWIVRVRGGDRDEGRKLSRSSSEIVKGLDYATRQFYEPFKGRAGSLLEDLRKAGGGVGSPGAVIRKGLMAHLHEHAVQRNDPGSTTQWERRFQLVQETAGSRVLWSWREVTG